MTTTPPKRLEDLPDGGGRDAEYPRDVWQLSRLNLGREHGNIGGSIVFDDIPNPGCGT